MTGDPPVDDDHPLDGDATEGEGSPVPHREPDEVDVRTARRALRQVHREAMKAAAVYALVDMMVTVAIVGFLFAMLEIQPIPPVALPPVVANPLAEATGVSPDVLALSGTVVVGILAGIVVAAVELWRLSRFSLVEWFERGNPETAEALRTAHDVVQDDDDRPMARALYRDVVRRLRAASADNLVDPVRIGATILLIVLASIAGVQVAILGLTVDVGDIAANVTIGGQPPDADGAVPPQNGGDGTGGGLAPGDDILGEPENVTPGSVDIPVEIDTGGVGNEDVDRPYESGGFPTDGSDVVAEEAGFAPPEDLEDAELVREYNLRIRAATGDNRSVVGGGVLDG